MTYVPYKLISGGQTGVDQAALMVGKELGIVTGGCMPRGFRTNTGPRPDMAKLYGMTEHSSAEYAPRTKANVEEANAIIVLGMGESPGCKLTRKIALQLGRPCIYEPWEGGIARTYDAGRRVAAWLQMRQPRVVMIAGNREETTPGVGSWAAFVLKEAFRS